MSNTERKYLVVGQGLAGTIVSFNLFNRGVPHVVLDNNHKRSATKAAAGLINPITGRHYVKSWMVEDLIEQAEQTYTAFEQLLNVSLIKRRQIVRGLNNPEQFNKWTSASAKAGYERFISDPQKDHPFKDTLNHVYRHGIINNAYQINISLLVESYQVFLREREMLIPEEFNFNQLDYNATGSIKYKSKPYRGIIFCEGAGAVNNPYFEDLPFQLAKGEALEIKIAELETDLILRDEIFFVPIDDSFWSGGGYKWQFEDHHPTKEWLEDWTSKLNNILKVPYEIVNHKAGVRPCVKGRRPLIGIHPDLKSLYIFNGMGTKGTSLAPYWANHFVDAILQGTDISPEVNISRFSS